ncbi:MAG: hypothetical protein JSV84_04910 [Gemmatimonadota bacterium]|nr:MAG: hypothetical protein JSV84_04910 [Gemmatimonadota bacterium]
MKIIKLVLTMSMLTVLVRTISGNAQIAQPGLIYYKGSLVDSQGKLVQDTLSMKFSIYNVSSGGTAMWSEALPAVIVWGGVYNVLLGSREPIPAAIFWDSVPASVVRLGGDRWLGVEVMGDSICGGKVNGDSGWGDRVSGNSELIPRKRITTVAYAYHADVLDGRQGAEFVSSVHPDTMEGVDGCSDTVPMLTVNNDCDGGAVLGECPTGKGVIGAGEKGVYGSTSITAGIPVHGNALNPGTQAGYFHGNVIVNGDAQVGLTMADYHSFRIAGKDAWGYFYSPGAGTSPQPSGMDMAFNFHEDGTGTDSVDNSSSGMGTSRIRLSDGFIELSTNGSPLEPLSRVIIDTNGVIFYGPIATPMFKVDTLYVPDTCFVNQKLKVTGSVGIGAPAPTSMKLHVKGPALKHIAYFEDTLSSHQGDGIAIKLSNGIPSHSNDFVSFLDRSGDVRGRIEGQSSWSDLTSHSQFYKLWKIRWDYEAAKLAIGVVGIAASFNVCGGVGFAICAPAPSKIAYAITWGVLYGVYRDKFVDYMKNHIGVSYNSGDSDYAEWLKRMDPGELMEPGDIVGIRGGEISKSTEFAQQYLVISTAPVVLGNMPSPDELPDYEKVTFMGQVPVKVIGAVKEGDYIIPSGFEDGTGVAVSPELMTAAEFSRVVGRAWSGSHAQSVKMVNVAIGLNAYDVALTLGKQTLRTKMIRDRVEELKSKLTQLMELDRKLSTLKATLEDDPISPSPFTVTREKKIDDRQE